MIGFYWQEILEARSVAQLKGIRKLLIPCVVVITSIILLEIIGNILRGVGLISGALTIFTISFYLLVLLVVSSFLLIAGTRILIILHKGTSTGVKHEKVTNMTIFLILVGFSLLLQTVLTLLFFFLSDVHWVNYVVNASMCTTTFLLAKSFRIKKKGVVSTARQNSSKTVSKEQEERNSEPEHPTEVQVEP